MRPTKPPKSNHISLVFVFGPLPSQEHVWRVVRFIAHFVSSARVGELFYPLRLEFREGSCVLKAAGRERFGWSCDWLMGILLSSDRPGSAPPSEAHPVVIRTWSVDKEEGWESGG